MSDKKSTAAKLLQINAIRLNIQKPFTWASGWKSPIYCDNRKALSYPFIREYIKSELCNEVFTQFPEADMLAGVATAGIPWGAMVADQLKLPYIYVRPKPKEHGLGNQVEGDVSTGSRVVVIEDLVSTGKSSLQVVEVLEQKGKQVEGMVAIFQYGFDVAISAFKAKNIQLETLTNYETLIHLAIEKGIVNESDQKSLLNWRASPETWG